MMLYFVTFVLAFCSLIYELCLARTIILFSDHEVTWYSLVIGGFLLAMGAGAAAYGRRRPGSKAIRGLLRVERKLVVAGFVSVAVIHAGHMIYSFFWLRDSPAAGLVVFFLLAFSAVLYIGYQSGQELPFLMDLSRERNGESRLNRILAFDYFGTLAAGLVFPLLLMPHLSLFQIAWLTALGNAGILLLLGFICKGGAGKRVVEVVCVAVILLALTGHDRVEQYFLKKYYYFDEAGESGLTLFAPPGNLPDIRRRRSAVQTIDMVEVDAQPEDQLSRLIASYSGREPRTGHHALFIDQSFQLWSGFEELYHETFAHVPVILQGRVPENILVLGAGDGMLVRELLKYEVVETVTLVEIDPVMIEMAKEEDVFQSLNQVVFGDPRLNVVIQDAYHFVRQNNSRYDAVYLDFPDPASYQISKLVSREMLAMIRNSLAEGGFVALNAPGIKPSSVHTDAQKIQHTWSIYEATLRAAGFQSVVPYASQLELSNEEAADVVEEGIGEHTRLIVRESGLSGTSTDQVVGKDAIVRRMLGDFVRDYRQQFIFASNRNQYKDKDIRYYDPGVVTDVMNEERFYLSFVFPYDETEQRSPGDAEKALVHSVFRPALPDRPVWWRLKLPY